MSYRTLYYALVIPGIGTTFNLLEPYAFYEGDNTLGGGVTSYSNIQAILTSPEVLSTKINPMEGSVDAGSIDFELIAPGGGVEISNVPAAPNLDIAALFTRKVLEFDGILAEDISPSDTTLFLYSASGALFVNGDVIYLERETIQLGTFIPVSGSGNVQRFDGCTRGLFGSRATEHFTKTTAGNPQNPYAGYDNRVYFQPKMIGREVYVTEHDGTNLNVVFRGVLTDVQMSQNMSCIKVQVKDLFTLYASRTFNKQAYGPDDKNKDIDIEVTVGDADETYFQIIQPSSLFTNNFGPGLRPNTAVGPTTYYTYALLQVKDSLVPGIWFHGPDRASTPDYIIPTYYAFADEELLNPPFRVRYPPASILPALVRPRSTNIIGSPAFEEAGKFEEPVFEVLAFGREIMDKEGLEVGALNPVNVLNPYHPLTAWLSHTCSTGRRSSTTTYGATNGTYDLWRYQWGMGVPQEMVDVSGIEQLIADTSDQVIQNAVVFGWGGATWTPADFREKVLTPFFFFPHVTADYKLTISQLTSVLPSQASIVPASKVEKMTEMQNFNLDSRIQTLEAKYKLPWTEEGRIIAQDLGQGVDFWDPNPKDPDFNFDVTAFRQDAYLDVEQQFQTLGPRSTATYTMLNWFKEAIPSYQFVITQPSFIPYPGQKVGLEVSTSTYTGVGVYLDNDGNRLGGSASKTIYGYVTEVMHRPRSAVYEIELWAVNEILIDTPKQIAPSFDVALIPSPGFVDVLRDPASGFGVDLLPFVNFLISEGIAEVQRWDRRNGAIAWNGVDQYGTIIAATTPNPNEIRLQFSSNPLALSVEEFLRLVPRTTATGLSQNDTYAYIANENGLFTGGDVGDIYVL